MIFLVAAQSNPDVFSRFAKTKVGEKKCLSGSSADPR